MIIERKVKKCQAEMMVRKFKKGVMKRLRMIGEKIFNSWVNIFHEAVVDSTAPESQPVSKNYFTQQQVK